MAPTVQDHSRRKNVLLFQKLLNLRDGASPFTLVLDTLEQPAGPIVNEFALRAKRISNSKVIYLRQSALKAAPHADVLVNTRGKNLNAIRAELLSHFPPVDGAASKQVTARRTVVIFDSLNRLATGADELGDFLSSIISPVVSLVAIYHSDVPLILSRAHNEYAPPPLTLLIHMATAILRLSNLHHEIERQKARNRSLEEPEFGLNEGKEGVLIGLHDKPGSGGGSGLVVGMELRRRSGRSVTESFVVTFPDNRDGRARPATFCLLETHPAFAAPQLSGSSGGVGAEDEEQPESTFNLGLTQKQREDREGVVLPYFDAQTDIGAGEGGRILYDMGREDMDDFDDEEDEI